ncbi:MAG: helix-turn-helix domain-containing protein [Syntrophales bacterium]|nr:helix-turn-helix domain-containing protein [Syntrophales bacterium]MDD5233087.1 helix-turn-helix domain-containing protein [Syntrophales bacterium]MDD5533242.1 helix-turn-helix domain-containing protein [Syntrophales bacterium]
MAQKKHKAVEGIGIGHRVKDLRLKKRITLQDLEAKSGLDRALLSEIEKGLILPPVATLLKLSKALCDNCYYFCPDLAVVRESEKTERRINYDYCKGCGLCVAECPRNAMTLEEEGR